MTQLDQRIELGVSAIRASLLVLVLMLFSAVAAVMLKPKMQNLSDEQAPKLEAIIPESFSDWVVEPMLMSSVVNPQQQAEVSKFYSATLARVFRNKAGRRIMLSLAYGQDQTKAYQVHKPEVCYPAQGFEILAITHEDLRAGVTTIPVARMIAKAGTRQEAVTYWIRFGDRIARGVVEQNLLRIQYGLSGSIPDGLLFRTSEITVAPSDSFLLQEQFIKQLLEAATPDARRFLVGDKSLPESGRPVRANY